jgi:hypothetical protein
VAEPPPALSFDVADGFGLPCSGWLDLPQLPEGSNRSAAFRRRKASLLGVASSLPSRLWFTVTFPVLGSAGVFISPWTSCPPAGFRRGAPGSLGRRNCPYGSDGGGDALLNFPSAVRF